MNGHVCVPSGLLSLIIPDINSVGRKSEYDRQMLLLKIFLKTILSCSLSHACIPKFLFNKVYFLHFSLFALSHLTFACIICLAFSFSRLDCSKLWFAVLEYYRYIRSTCCSCNHGPQKNVQCSHTHTHTHTYIQATELTSTRSPFVSLMAYGRCLLQSLDRFKKRMALNLFLDVSAIKMPNNYISANYTLKETKSIYRMRAKSLYIVNSYVRSSYT
jgi:hypothetical protein